MTNLSLWIWDFTWDINEIRKFYLSHYNWWNIRYSIWKLKLTMTQLF